MILFAYTPKVSSNLILYETLPARIIIGESKRSSVYLIGIYADFFSPGEGVFTGENVTNRREINRRRGLSPPAGFILTKE